MADDWEDFEVPQIVAAPSAAAVPPPVPKFDDEEEDLTLKQLAATNTAKSAAAQKEKEREADLKLAAKLKQTQVKDETDEQRRLRERAEIEKADAAVAGDLFGASNGGGSDETDEERILRGIGAIPIKTNKDHEAFALICATKMEESTSFGIAAFYKELTSHVASKLTVEGCETVLKLITAVRDEKKRTEAKPVVKQSAKQAKQKMKAHNSKYADGDFDEVDHYDDKYGGIEDDYMF